MLTGGEGVAGERPLWMMLVVVVGMLIHGRLSPYGAPLAPLLWAPLRKRRSDGPADRVSVLLMLTCLSSCGCSTIGPPLLPRRWQAAMSSPLAGGAVLLVRMFRHRLC